APILVNAKETAQRLQSDEPMPPRGKLKTLPPALREELDRRLIEGNFSSYRELTKWLAQQGFHISDSSIHRYGSRLEQRLEAIRIATDQARLVVETSPDEDSRITEALLRLVQQHLFSVLVELSDSGLKQANLASIARSVAEMARASVLHRKFVQENREKLAAKVGAAERKVVAAARDAAAAGAAGGLSAEAEQQIRNALLEIAE
ncbi:MAG TPA: phage protein Gp27 family protein, partial [Candidatus Binataceae bacterium]|nr:phage protein Gp27 family protein [Candidatus Binataceae bacterium]